MLTLMTKRFTMMTSQDDVNSHDDDDDDVDGDHYYMLSQIESEYMNEYVTAL